VKVRRRTRSLHVFLNAPFDPKYKPIFDAVVFAIIACGYEPRCSLESSDSGTPRIGRLRQLINECDLSIHDLSRTQSDENTGLPRFNMPFEFGLFIGARDFGGPNHRGKTCLVLAEHQFVYQRYISDVAGNDISMHGSDPHKAIASVRHFLRSHSNASGATRIIETYEKFKIELPRLADLPQFKYDSSDLHFKDYVALARAFLAEEGWSIVTPSA